MSYGFRNTVNNQIQTESESEKATDEQEASTPIATGSPPSVEEQPANETATTPIEISDADQTSKVDEKEQIVNIAEEIEIEPSRSQGPELQAATSTNPIDNATKNPIQTKDLIKRGHDKLSSPKSKLVAGLLALFLGLVGAQWFYLNKPVRAIIYLLITFASIFIVPGAVSIWQLFLLGESIFFFVAKATKVEKYSKQTIRQK